MALNVAKMLHGEHVRCLLVELVDDECPPPDSFSTRRRLHRHVRRYTGLPRNEAGVLVERMLEDAREDESCGRALMRMGLFTATPVEPLSVTEALRVLGAPTSHLSAARNMRFAVTKRLAYDAAAKGDERAVFFHLREAQRLLEGG